MSVRIHAIDTTTPPGTVAELGRVNFRTDVLSLANDSGKQLRAYLDVPLDNARCAGVALIAPAYGETKENNLFISASLAANGYYGLRFDWSDHVGESDGEIFTSTLSKMRADLNVLVDYVRKSYEGQKIGIVATSLAARVALKVVARDKCIDFLICITPVVNLQSTLSAIYREDLVSSFRKGKRYGTLNILGFSIDADGFLSDSIEQSFAEISSALADAAQISIPTFFVLGQRDSWVQTADAQAVFGTIASTVKESFVLSKMLHRLVENPPAAEEALRRTIPLVIQATTKCNHGDVEFRVPATTDLQIRAEQEKEHLKDLYVYSKSEEQYFWKEYLSNFQYIINVHDFYNLLESIYNQLGGAWSGQRILDAGCGIGNYALFLLTKQLYRSHQDIQYLQMPPIRYFGVDFVTAAVSEAALRLDQLKKEFEEKRWLSGTGVTLLESHFIVADLDAEIPCRDNFFDQICCNLVLSYLQQPRLALREMWRVLRPGGKIVITSLKPGADLSEIYRNFMSVAETPKELDEGRRLLANAGLIKIKEVRGLYHFYSERELKDAVRETGFVRARTYRSFGDQANVVVCWKSP